MRAYLSLAVFGVVSALVSSGRAQPALPPPASPSPAAAAEEAPPAPPSPQLSEERDPVRLLAPAAKAPASPEPPPPAVVIAEEAQPKDEPAKVPKAPHRQYVSLGLGFRAAVVESAGFDPFSESNALPMTTLFGTVTPWASAKPVSIHLAFEWDYGGSGATARAIPSSIDVHRLALGLEGRYLPISRIALFVRAMPAAIHAGGTVEDVAFTGKLTANAWTWGFDLTGGAAARVGAFGPSDAPNASIWIGLDMGYRLAGAASMRLRPGDLTEEDQGRHFGEIPLRDLDLSGFVARLSASVSF